MAFAGNLTPPYMGAWTETCWLFSMLHTWFIDALRAKLTAKFELMRTPEVVEADFPANVITCASVTEPI